MAEITVNEAPVVIARQKKRPLVLDILIRMFKTKPLGFFGLVIVSIMILTAALVDLTWLGIPIEKFRLTPYGWNEIMLQHRLAPPGAGLLLGADNVGRDLLTRVMYGARISLTVMVIAQGLTLVIKLLVAIPSGYWAGSTFDTILQRFIDAWSAIPNLALYLTVMAVLGPGLLQVAFVLGINGGLSATRVLRSAVIRIKEDQYFEAARAIGVPTSRIMLRHVIPNVMPIIVIQLASGMGGVISAEASLSFLGFGIPPPFPSWGGMLSGAGRQYMMVAPWMMIWPGVALSLVIFSFQMLADALRDLIDPRLRGGLGRYGGMTQAQLEKLAEKKMAKGRAATQKLAAGRG
ncbi:MAG: hypothetical protein A2Z28_04140 [Chloroflexi bacterium RBG_16_51_9]|nr:MAG: hypothetical protein A2Z28_04140 [Chloroflexi bacterium RBG_16_51_9]